LRIRGVFGQRILAEPSQTESLSPSDQKRVLDSYDRTTNVRGLVAASLLVHLTAGADAAGFAGAISSLVGL
jgi:hypothetical protein